MANLSPEMKKIMVETKLMSRLIEVHEQFLDGIEDIKELAALAQRASSDASAQLRRVNELPKGAKGERGERGPQGLAGKAGRDGLTPVKGTDYFTKAEMEEIADLAAGLVLPGMDGMTPEINELALFERFLKKLKEDKALKPEDIEGLTSEVSSYRNQLSGASHGGLAGKQYGKNTWARGGGGGSTTSGLTVTTQYLLTAVQAGLNVTINLTQLTNFATFSQIITLYRNNIPQTEGVNFTFASPTVTVTDADAGEVFSITYSYA